ncbi:DUF6522 family protein [Flavimaricola marinus]|uniref:Uncharacterized protein n=1 Tax=Flavimaricola marinus TaxID=1819565 RepID=A0A238L9T6_9RHOB|nr:DUF6522 family protein [Flavimaricola marinus]SMY06371.1 hypothetical protein LOM8899_00494 [Flavimaricola marinus]
MNTELVHDLSPLHSRGPADAMERMRQGETTCESETGQEKVAGRFRPTLLHTAKRDWPTCAQDGAASGRIGTEKGPD